MVLVIDMVIAFVYIVIWDTILFKPLKLSIMTVTTINNKIRKAKEELEQVNKVLAVVQEKGCEAMTLAILTNSVIELELKIKELYKELAQSN